MYRILSHISLIAALALPVTAGALPARAHIAYDARIGTLDVGKAEQRWTLDDNGHYTLETELVPILGPHIRYVSHGDVGKQGLQPTDYAEFRGNGGTPRRLIRFDWPNQAVEYGSPDALTSGKLQLGAQELNVLPFQLAWLGNKQGADMQLATGHKLIDDHFGLGKPVRVSIMGQGRDTRIWEAPGSEEKTEVWLAPALANLPVRIIRNTELGELQLIARTIEFDSDKP
jgi:hypothetical protein